MRLLEVHMEMRLALSRFTSSLIIKVERQPGFSPLLRPLKSSLGFRIAGAVLDHRRPYPSLSEAQLAASKRARRTHSDRENIELQLALAEHPRISDYPVMFYL